MANGDSFSIDGFRDGCGGCPLAVIFSGAKGEFIMKFREVVAGVLTVGAVAAGGVAVASPAWAAEDSAAHNPGCRLIAEPTKKNGNGLKGTGKRVGCSDTVTYFWVRIYQVIEFWPDAERGVKGENYVQDTELDAFGGCGGHGAYYTHSSTATGVSGDSVESRRVTLC